MRSMMLLSMVAAGILCAAPALAGGGGPTQLMPSQPWPPYCGSCFGQWQTPTPPSPPPPPAVTERPASNAPPTRASKVNEAPK